MAYRFAVLILVAQVACVDLARPHVLLGDAGPWTDAAQSEQPDGPFVGEPAADVGQPGGGEAGLPTDAVPDSPPADVGPGGDLLPDAAALAIGKRCSDGAQCASSICSDGYCCATACPGPCQACDLSGLEGTCSPVPAGLDPRGDCPQDATASCGRDGTCDGAGACRKYAVGSECAPGSCSGGTERAASTCDGNGACQPGSSRSCAPNVCTNGSCASSCTGQADCQIGFFCEGTTCRLRQALGTSCSADLQCASGHCIDGVCCGSPCGQSCYACNVAGAVGTCTPVPAGQDPKGGCPAEAATTCGRSGGCDGQGACRLHSAGTTCGAAGCMGSVASAARACDGLGVCLAGSTQDCSPYVCSGNACATSCTSTAQCKSGFYCSGVSCLPFGAGPALHWKLDESGGTSALDASGNGRVGTYVGTSGTPTASTLVPSVFFANPASRAFVAANRHAIRLDPTPAALKPANNITVSLWFRTTTLDSGHNPPASSEAISQGNNYFLRIRSNDIYWTRRTASGYAVCFATLSNHLDGNWHHLAGVLSPSGMKLYYDGVEKCSNGNGASMSYTTASELVVGRHGSGETQWDFDGNIDDVRIYTRALPAAEIAAVAAGF